MAYKLNRKELDEILKWVGNNTVDLSFDGDDTYFGVMDKITGKKLTFYKGKVNHKDSFGQDTTTVYKKVLPVQNMIVEDGYYSLVYPAYKDHNVCEQIKVLEDKIRTKEIVHGFELTKAVDGIVGLSHTPEYIPENEVEQIDLRSVHEKWYND